MILTTISRPSLRTKYDTIPILFRDIFVHDSLVGVLSHSKLQGTMCTMRIVIPGLSKCMTNVISMWRFVNRVGGKLPIQNCTTAAQRKLLIPNYTDQIGKMSGRKSAFAKQHKLVQMFLSFTKGYSTHHAMFPKMNFGIAQHSHITFCMMLHIKLLVFSFLVRHLTLKLYI